MSVPGYYPGLPYPPPYYGPPSPPVYYGPPPQQLVSPSRTPISHSSGWSTLFWIVFLLLILAGLSVGGYELYVYLRATADTYYSTYHTYPTSVFRSMKDDDEDDARDRMQPTIVNTSNILSDV